MTNHQKFLRRDTWMILLVSAVALFFTPTSARAQSSNCAAGALLYYADDGNQGYDIEQSACIYYDGESGVDISVETDNDAYEDWQDLGSLWIYGVGTDASVYGDGSTLYDSGMVHAATSDTGGDSVYINENPPWGYSVYGLSTTWDECYQAPGEYDEYGCTWATSDGGPLSGQYVTLQVASSPPSPPPTPTLSLTSSPTPSTYGQSVNFTATISVTVSGENISFFDTSTQTPLGTASISDTTGTTATFSTTALAVGTHSIIANYNGDSSYNSASSNTVTQVVNSYTSITYPSPAAGTIYSYIITPTGGASGYATNGNLLNFTDSVNGTWNNISYDNLNRLLFGASTSGYYQGLQINWGYDSFGNRTSESYSGSGVSLPISPTPQYNANNQVNDGSLGYDSAGNVIYDNSNQYLYDSEGRICAVYDRTFGGMTEYIYDAEGVRVAKGSIYSWTCDITQNSFSLTKTYVIGPSGEQLTETDGSGNWIHTNAYAAGQLIGTYNNAGLYFQLSDWLGTRRVETDYAGNTQETCTSLPFGNDSTNCVGPTEQFFTGKERDTESGNDYFGARYYASTMGRFTSPDPSGLMFADHTNPQSLNLYNYALNNPLQFIDPTGFYCYYGSTDADVSDPSQYDFHSKKAECTAVDENGNQGRWIDDPSTTVTVHANGSGSMDTTDIGFDGTIAYVNINHSEWTGRKTPPTDPCSSRNGRAYGPGHYARDYHLPANGTPIPAPEDGLVTGGRNNAPHIPGPYNYSQAAKPGSTNYTDFTGGSGYILRYVHTHPAVPFNSPLSQGQTMATSDMSGRTTGPHTHVQATDPSGARVDPNTYFSECH